MYDATRPLTMAESGMATHSELVGTGAGLVPATAGVVEFRRAR
jgi:hypothetical protein